MLRAEFWHDINAPTTMETPGTDRPEIDEPIKKLWFSYLLALPPHGLFGAYHYYLHRRKMGIVFSCSVGIFGFGWLVDLVRMYWLVRRVNRDYTKSLTDPLYLDDAYMVWFPLGLFGAHKFYLGDKRAGVFLLLTLGGFGVSWLLDGIMLTCSVRYRQEADTNQDLEHDSGVVRTIQDLAGYTRTDNDNLRIPSLATPLNNQQPRINSQESLHADPYEPPPYPGDHQLPSNGTDSGSQTHVEEMPPPPAYSSISLTDLLPSYDSMYTNDTISYM